jgi:toxin ParE1/3/4
VIYRLSLKARSDLIASTGLPMCNSADIRPKPIMPASSEPSVSWPSFPSIGISAADLAPGYRRFRFQSHYVFYTEEADHVLIRALIHVRQNLRPALFE